MANLTRREWTHPELEAAHRSGELDANALLAIEAEMKILAMRARRDALARNGWWNNTPYMLGLYNGTEEALALLEGREPMLRSEPEGGFLGRKPLGGHDA
jgi:hypothetical protein